MPRPSPCFKSDCCNGADGRPNPDLFCPNCKEVPASAWFDTRELGRIEDLNPCKPALRKRLAVDDLPRGRGKRRNTRAASPVFGAYQPGAQELRTEEFKRSRSAPPGKRRKGAAEGAKAPPVVLRGRQSDD